MKRSSFYSYVLLGLIAVGLGACVESTLPHNVDLSETVYFDRGISMIILNDTVDNEIYDSIFIDNERRTVHTVGAMTNKRIEYDDLGYITRILERADKPYNVSLNYQVVGDTLYQKWTPIKHYNWDYDYEDLDMTKSYIIKLKLNQAKKPVLEINDNRGLMKKFYYKTGNLSRIEVIDIETNQKLEIQLFQYQDDVLIKTETQDLEGKTEIIFDKELPYLFRRTNKDYKYTFKYNYY